MSTENSSDLQKAMDAATNSADIAAAVVAARDAAGRFVSTEKKAESKGEETEGFSRTETIGGKQFTFEAETELELERMVNNAYKVASAVQTVAPKVEETPKVDEAKVIADRVELDLKFKRGEITPREYLQKSGAIKEFLEEEGIPLTELKEAVEEKRTRGYEQSWEAATQEFLNSPAGANWPGGPKNLEIIGLKIAALGLTEAEDKVAALAQAYDAMKQTGMIFEYEPTAEKKNNTQSTNESQPVRQAATAAKQDAPKHKAASSSMFGKSSGVSAAATTAAPGKMDIDPKATPAEIMQQWKAQLLSEGRDPNAEFTAAYSSKK